MDIRDEAFEFVKKNGPILPTQLSTTINTNILFASAILSELTAKKKVKLTNLKRGGSPFYYISGQEEKLMDIAQYLSGKPKEAYDLISEKLVIRDLGSEPWLRVALREIKDFVVPLTVNISGRQELFWKWYLTSNDEAKGLIKKILSVNKEKNIVGEEKQEELPKDEETPVEEEKPVEKPEVVKEPQEENDFFNRILGFFSSNEMYVISQNIVRKGREFNFVIDVPSNLGKLRYFVKFKNKKSITESDLLNALKDAREDNLPVLFLTNGELNKKAQKYLDKNISGRLVFKNL